MKSAAPAIPETPIAAINTTPLIDVMLVLLIMFVITIPVATNSVDMNLPGHSEHPPTEPDPVKNKVVLLAGGTILWNGTPVTQAQLADLLRQTVRMPVEPELQFQPEPNASYDLSTRVLQIIKASQVTKFGFVGNDRFADFGK